LIDHFLTSAIQTGTYLCNPVLYNLLYCLPGGSACDAIFSIYSYQWTGGANGNLYIKFPSSVSAWTINVQFAAAVRSLSVWDGTSISCSGAVCTFSNAAYNGAQNAGTTITLGFQVNLTRSN
jgi:hypothetical protein